jgi:hypothetical protein
MWSLGFKKDLDEEGGERCEPEGTAVRVLLVEVVEVMAM